MGLALVIPDRSTDLLVEQIKLLNPDLDVQIWPNISRPQDVRFAVLWKQPQGLLTKFSKLQAVTSLGAGIDFIQNDKDLPTGIPIHRIVTAGLKQQMAQYILGYVLEDFRHFEIYRKQQQQSLWKIYELPPKPVVGFLGLGKIGKFVANQFRNLGFETLAYTHNSTDEEITCLHNENGLQQLMVQSDYIVCLLPLNEHTKGLLNYKRFSYCSRQPMLIHVGRGEQLIESDLLKALDEGLIKHAVIDVFAVEPLPIGNPLWQRKDITLTPHNAARSDNKQTAKEIIKLIKLL